MIRMTWPVLVLMLSVTLGTIGCAKKTKVAQTGEGGAVDTSALTQTVEKTDSGSSVDPKHTENNGTGVGFNRGGNTNYVAGGGAVQNIRQAGRRTVVLNDMHQLGVAISTVEVLDGMPDIARIKQEVRTFGPIATSIADGGIILTGTKNRNGLWAYEIDADKKGGIVLVGGTARRADAQEVQQLLKQK